MKKTTKPSKMLNIKGILILIAFGLGVNITILLINSIQPIEEILFSYSSISLLLVAVLYIAIIVIEFFTDIDKSTK